jgi:hypothetical protein
MIYFRTTDGRACMVIEMENLNRLVDGRPMKSPDGMILVCYTPDMAWTAEQVALFGDPEKVTGAQLAEIIDASMKRGKQKEAELGQVMLVSHTDEKVRVDFQKELRWFSMNKDQAIQFGLLIFQHCGVPVQVNLAPAPETQGGEPV